jgi:phenylalanyl-tRNA synthetase alpha chain
MSTSISTAELVRALALRDLTDPAAGPHAMQLLLAEIEAALSRSAVPVIVHRASPIVSIADNYDRLGYPPDGAARDARYTRYVCDSALLRTQTSALIPPLLCQLATAPPDDVVLACPGLVYRRDVIDRLHVGEPHQVDLWRIASRALDEAALDDMIRTVVTAALPGRRWRTLPAEHPYTTHGRQIDVDIDDEWIEIGECGLASPALLAASCLPDHTGLAMGLGLDRLLMLRKGIDDIRLLRASDPRIASQLLDLEPYRPVSMMPPVRRDLSVVVSTPRDAETLGDQVRSALAARADLVEAVEVVSATPYAQLPAAAVGRLGIAPGQWNLLVRVTLRALDRTLTHDECNVLRDDIYAAIHEGAVHHWANELSRRSRSCTSEPSECRPPHSSRPPR